MSTVDQQGCKRRYPRFETSFEGVLHGEPGSPDIVCQVIDVSLVGARLLTDKQLAVDATLSLEIRSKGKAGLTSPVKVKHSESHAESGRYLTGVQMLPSCFEERKAIAEFISFVFQGQTT